MARMGVMRRVVRFSRGLLVLPAVAAMLVATSCGLDAEAKAGSVCVEQAFPDRPVPGVPGGVGVPPAVSDVLSGFTFDIEIGDVVPEDLEDNGVDAEVNARSIALTSVGRVANFAGVTLLTFDVVPPPGSGRQPVPFRYERAAGATGPLREVEARPTAPIDLIDYLQDQDRIRITNLQLAGNAPSESWTPALRTCGDTKVEVDYVEAAGL
jgi:hypothetical protein